LKIIGAELRIAPQGYVPIEAKIIPLELAIPDVFVETPYRQVRVELTIHTSAGDVTSAVELPQQSTMNAFRQVSEDEFCKAYDELRKRVEAMP